jgi:23S rRNA pseudouridine1911/1915/1917 synthase
MAEYKAENELEDELFEHHRFEAAKGQSPLRVDKFLMNLIENTTRNKIQQAAESGSILVNNLPVKSYLRAIIDARKYSIGCSV